MNDLSFVQQQVIRQLSCLDSHNFQQREQLDAFIGFARSSPNCCERTLTVGHFTGSAWLVSGDGLRALLLHHRKLNRWLQPGGHADGDSDLARVALREAEEETGLVGLSVQGDVFDIDRHMIPARGNEPEHWHYDVRYVIRAGNNEAFIGNAESNQLAWCNIKDMADDSTFDESLRRMARNWLAQQAIKPGR